MAAGVNPPGATSTGPNSRRYDRWPAPRREERRKARRPGLAVSCIAFAWWASCRNRSPPEEALRDFTPFRTPRPVLPSAS